MAEAIKSQQELYDLFVNALRDYAPDLTDVEEGSIIDSFGGALSFAGAEINRGIVDAFAKTFFNTAHGPEITGSADDLATLAVDHFGDEWARPAASMAVGIANFTRPTSAAGNILIPAGTIVKTSPDANGNTQRFATLLDVTMTGTSINASCEALVGGSEGNAGIGSITAIESTLLDSTIVVGNSAAFSGGAAAQDDSTYRETIRNLISALRGASLAAIEAKAKTVSGVVTATAIEVEKVVKEWIIASSTTTGEYFRIPYVTLYIADANGAANDALLALVRTAIEVVRAAGVRIGVAGATAVTVNWTISITLNPSGPNYSTFQSDLTKVKDEMKSYINKLPIGTGFTRSTAMAAILAIWGPTGTNDITSMTTSLPVADVSASATQKMVAGTMGTS